MIGRTMSYLSLTVVAAAVFLVSGCVPPIDAPDSGEQVWAVEAERIEKLESKVDGAVEAASPEAIKSKVDEAVEAADPNGVLAFLAGKVDDKDPKQPKQPIKTLKTRLLDILCSYEVTLKLDPLAYDKVEEKIKPYLDRLAKLPQPKKEDQKEDQKDRLPLVYSGYLTYTGYTSLAKKLNAFTIAADFDGAAKSEGCELTGKAHGGYLSVAGDLAVTAQEVFDFVFSLQLKVPEDSEAWLVIPSDHWITGLEGYMVNKNDEMEETRRSKALEANKKFREWLGKHVDGESSIYIDHDETGSWSDPESLTGVVRSSLPSLIKKLVKDGKTMKVYLMVTRMKKVEILEKDEVLRVVFYRAYDLGAPGEGRIALGEEYPISPSSRVSSPKVPCFPDIHKEVRRIFTRILSVHRGWKCE